MAIQVMDPRHQNRAYPAGTAAIKRAPVRTGLSSARRWIAAAGVLLIAAVAVAWLLSSSSVDPTAADQTLTADEYSRSKPAGAPPSLTAADLAPMTTAAEDTVADPNDNGSLIELQADLTVSDIVDDPKNLAVGQVYEVSGREGPVTLQFDIAHFQLVDAKVQVVATDPDGKVLQTVRGLDRDAARRKMLELNRAGANVEIQMDPDQPAHFVAREKDLVITLDGDPAEVLSDEVKSAFGLDRTFYMANPVKK